MNFRLVKFIGTKTRVFICPFKVKKKTKTAKVYGLNEKWWPRASVRKVSESDKKKSENEKKKSEGKKSERDRI